LHPDELTVNTTVTIVGNRCLGTTDLRLIQQARRLAQAAGVEFLAVHFRTDTSGMQFWGADLSPNIFSPELVDAILDYFSERQPPC
jgi:hypothetical protein